MTESVSRVSVSQASAFDVNRVDQAFAAALRDSSSSRSAIGTQDYINGYRELLKFIDQLGYIFKFVKDDVVDKLAILQRFVDKDNDRTLHFDTVQKAIDYETDHHLIETNPENFTRTLLRLHRALLFIIEFLRASNDRPASETTATIANSCYESTLSNHHGFFIRQSVKIGFRMLPTRKQLDEAIFHGRKAELLDEYKTFIKTIKQIYDTIEASYAERKYLQLP